MAASVPPARPSAVADSYARLNEAFSWLRVSELAEGEKAPSGEGWTGIGELTAGGAALDAYLRWDEEQVLRDYGERGRPDVIAGFGLHRYAYSGCLLLTLPWFLRRRVPHLSVADVTFHREEGRLAVRTGAFSCLPADPAAALPGARVVADEAALREALLGALTAHLRPLLDRFGPRMRRRGRALWGMATDDITEGLWAAGRALGEEDRATRELSRLLPGGTLPYTGAAGFRELPGHDGARLLTRDRISCCFSYTLGPGDTCDTCPRTCDADRLARRLATAV
ncbi:(2Fe-2S)-binding protein [Streptomyces sp. SCSIO ZS0520]|uniref:(2Fe-2S)-binding protein n=1 Tax=Streptomyces sp. SCSIO ZS0520 TaxID=2892996 RepID=UPI0021DB752C|nr:(2Fe-2S)-binding protein [Streptomyces sp. SCSIO ZS0520]